MRSPLLWIALRAIGLGFLATSAMAQVSTECNRQTPQNCLDGVGSGVTSLDSLRINLDVNPSGSDDSENVEGQISLDNRLRSRAAGDGFSGWSVWGGYTYSDFESVTRAPYEATLHGFVIGADTLFTDQLLFGVFAGYV